MKIKHIFDQINKKNTFLTFIIIIKPKSTINFIYKTMSKLEISDLLNTFSNNQQAPTNDSTKVKKSSKAT